MLVYKTAMQNTFEGSVRTMTHKGLGVVDHPEGRVYFVRGVWPGDRGIFRITSTEKRYGFADLVELQSPSPDRIASACPHLGTQVGQCGGCPWLIGSYPSQLKIKEELVATALKRNDLLSSFTKVVPIKGSSRVLGYRNRAQFKTDGKKLGYVSPESHVLVDIKECVILNDAVKKQMDLLRQKLPVAEWMATSGKHKWNFLDVDDEIPQAEINRRLPFKQGNSEQNSYMKKWLFEKLSTLARSCEVLELFAGAGNFTEILSPLGFAKIFAFEMSGDAIRSLQAKNLPNVQGHALNIYESPGWKEMARLVQSPQVLVLDPPREGFQDVAQFLKLFPAIEQIVYISCDLSTWTRDVKSLKPLGFELQEIQPLDQFPNTPHIEILSILKRK